MPARQFIKIIVWVPLVILAGVWTLNAIVDPFGTSAISPLHYDRYPVAIRTNPWMYKAARIHESTATTAIFGDSTIARLDPEQILPSVRSTIANFAVPGDGLDDSFVVIDYTMNDYAKRGRRLASIVLGVSVYRFTEGSTPRPFTHNAAIINQPFGRNLNVQTTAVAIADLHAMMTASVPHERTPAQQAALLKDEKHTVLTAMKMGGNSVNRSNQLLALACSLQRDGVTLTILIPPYSETLDAAINQALPDANPTFNTWLRTMPYVLDYDGPGKFASSDNYIDLIHLKYDRARVLLEDMLLDKPKLAAEYRNPHACDGWSPPAAGTEALPSLASRH